MNDLEVQQLIWELQKINGAKDFSGECSCQVLIPLTDGNTLRIGITDDDVATVKGLWWDFWPNKHGKFGTQDSNEI